MKWPINSVILTLIAGMLNVRGTFYLLVFTYTFFATAFFLVSPYSTLRHPFSYSPISPLAQIHINSPQKPRSPLTSPPISHSSGHYVLSSFRTPQQQLPPSTPPNAHEGSRSCSLWPSCRSYIWESWSGCRSQITILYRDQVHLEKIRTRRGVYDTSNACLD